MIHLRRLLTAAAVLALAGTTARAADPSPEAERAAELARQLADPSFRRREAAASELDRIGEAALPALKAILANGEEAEARRRAATVAERIGRRVESARLLAPTIVELKVTDAPLSEVIASLSKQGGMAISLNADPAVARRKVTLDTGKVSFWEAIDKLCEVADLTEIDPQEGTAGSPATPQPAQPAPPVQRFVNPEYRVGLGGVPMVDGPIVLAPGKDRRLPTARFGAVRMQVGTKLDVPPGQPYPVLGGTGGNEYTLPILVRPESRLRWQGIRAVQVDLAIDEHGQSLSAPSQGMFAYNPYAEEMMIRGGLGKRIFINRPDYGMAFHPTRVHLRVEKGDKPAKKFSELRGKLVVALQVPPEELVAVPNVAEAKGALVKGTQNVELGAGNFRVLNAANGQYELEAELKYSVGEIQPAGPAQPAPGVAPANRFMGLALFDEKGGEYSFQYCPQQSVSQNGNLMVMKMKMVYTRMTKDQPAPAKLAFLATHTATAEIPFAFKDVTLP